MKIVKIAAIVILVYVGVVGIFESFLGAFQPQDTSTIVITTTDGAGTAEDRVVSPVDSEGRLYVSANHWPRSWYKRALDNPKVQVTRDGQTSDHLAVPVSGPEHDRLKSDHAHSVFFRLLTGFPPRYFLRLDPR